MTLFFHPRTRWAVQSEADHDSHARHVGYRAVLELFFSESPTLLGGCRHPTTYHLYHWRELPQVSFLSRQMFCRGTRLFVSMFAVTKLLSQQNYVSRQNIFVVTHICRDKNVFVTTKVLSRQAYFCRDKRRVLSQQTHVCCDKSKLVATKLCLL